MFAATLYERKGVENASNREWDKQPRNRVSMPARFKKQRI